MKDGGGDGEGDYICDDEGWCWIGRRKVLFEEFLFDFTIFGWFLMFSGF